MICCLLMRHFLSLWLRGRREPGWFQDRVRSRITGVDVRDYVRPLGMLVRGMLQAALMVLVACAMSDMPTSTLRTSLCLVGYAGVSFLAMFEVLALVDIHTACTRALREAHDHMTQHEGLSYAHHVGKAQEAPGVCPALDRS